MALSITGNGNNSAVPLLSRLMRSDGNTSKLQAAKTLLRVIAPVFARQEKKKRLTEREILIKDWTSEKKS